MDVTQLPNKAPEYKIETLFEAGCHFGHNKKKWHPKMAKFIYAQKDGVHIFDLEKTAQQLQLAYNFMYDLGKNKKTVIFVGTKTQAKNIIKEAAEDAGVFHIYSRWLGGFLTNWEQVSKSLKRMIDIEEGFKTDKFKGYTKFEQVQLEKEKGRLERFFAGVKGLKTKPDCLFVVDPKREHNAIAEAKKLNVPVVALIDSNANPDLVDLPIPANDDAVGSIKFIVDEIAKAYKEGTKEGKKA